MSNTVSSDISAESDSNAEMRSRSAPFVMDEAAVATLRLWLWLGLLLPLLCMAPLLYVQSLRLLNQQAFWYFPFAIALAVWLLFRTCSYRPASLIRGRLAFGLWWSGVVAATLGVYLYSPWVIHVAATVVALAWALGAFGGSAWTRVLTICSLFLVTVPLPSGRDMYAIAKLHAIASWCSNGILDAMSIPNIVEGDQMQIVDSKLRLSVVCDGVDSIFAFAAIGVAVIALRRCSFLSGLFTLLTIPFFFVFENTLRLLMIAIGLVYFQAELGTGWMHTGTAVVVFIVTALSFWLTHKFIVAMLEPLGGGIDKLGLVNTYQKFTRWPVDAEGQLAMGPKQLIWKPALAVLAGAMGLLLLLGAISVYAAMTLTDNVATIAEMSEEKAALLPSDDAFSDSFKGLKKVDFRNSIQPGTAVQGKYSRHWRFDAQGSQVFVSLDFPFLGWQPSWAYYQASGWNILEIKPVEDSANSGQAWTVEEFKMQNQYGLYGYVLFAFFDENGTPIDRKKDTEQLSRKNIFERLKNSEPTAARQAYQVQVVFESGRELSEAEVERNRKLFFVLFEHIRQQSQSAVMKAK